MNHFLPISKPQVSELGLLMASFALLMASFAPLFHNTKEMSNEKQIYPFTLQSRLQATSFWKQFFEKKNKLRMLSHR